MYNKSEKKQKQIEQQGYFYFNQLMVGYTNSKNYTEKKQNRKKQKCQY